MRKSSIGTGTTAKPQSSPTAPAGPPAAVYRGRFAPSPTGPLHFGSLLAAAGSWLDARAAHGQWLVRIEDLDPPREPPGAAAEILRALEAFDLWWDDEVLFQSTRQHAYDETLARLDDGGWTYPCWCSRSEIEAANRGRGCPESRRYPGTCRKLAPAGRGEARIIRVRTGSEPVGIIDRLQGKYSQALSEETGDFVLRRREGYIAYQLAVVVDDHAQGITDVVRGIDLLDSTPRQVWLQRLLGFPTPEYMHLPVVIQPGGEKLSKQTSAAAVDPADAARLCWQVLACLGQTPPEELRGAPPRETWAWGIAHWHPQQMAAVRHIPAPE